MIDLPDPEDLNKATERLNEVLLEAESALRSLQLGVVASVPLYDDGRALQFRKLDNVFQLVLTDGAGEVRPIMGTSRDSRVRAAESLPRLLTALSRSYQAEVERVTSATTAVTGFVARLRACIDAQ
jgi:hypothetical protein